MKHLNGNRSLTINESKTMRKIYSFMVAAVATFAAISCTQELGTNNPAAPESSAEKVTYTASIDNSESKASLNEESRKSEWNAGDAITVLDGSRGWTFKTEESGANVNFSNSEGFGEYRPVIAVYPAVAEDETYTAALDTKTVTAKIATNQQAQLFTYNKDAALAVAYSENNDFAFKNAHTLLKFTINGENVTHVVFHGNLAETISGEVSVSLSEQGTSVICEDQTYVKAHVWRSENDKHFLSGENNTYYMVIAPKVFAEGVSVKVQVNGGEEILVKHTSKEVESKVNTILDLGELVVPTSSGWALPGGYNAWNESYNFLYEYGDYYVAKNVKVMDTQEGKDIGFKFKHNTYGWKGVSSTNNLSAGEWYKLNGENNIRLDGSSEVAYDIYMTKDGSRFQAVAAGSAIPNAPVVNSANPNCLYLNPNMWNVDGARFAAYFFGDGEKWISMSEPDGDGIYEVEKPTDKNYTSVIFCRMNGSNQTNNWCNKWNQSGDLTIPKNGNNLFTPSKWDGATTTWTQVTEF